jgi:hypothetical protein
MQAAATQPHPEESLKNRIYELYGMRARRRMIEVWSVSSRAGRSTQAQEQEQGDCGRRSGIAWAEGAYTFYQRCMNISCKGRKQRSELHEIFGTEDNEE